MSLPHPLLYSLLLHQVPVQRKCLKGQALSILFHPSLLSHQKMRHYKMLWCSMAEREQNISFREESPYRSSFSLFSTTAVRAKGQQFTCMSMVGLSRVMSLCTSTWIPPSTWHKAVTSIVLSVVNCCWYSLYGILMGNCFSGREKKELINGFISPQSFIPNISVFLLCCVWD